MIYKLTQSNFENVRPLVHALDYHLTIQAVIDGVCPGRIYVDDAQIPKSAFIYTVEGGFLAGDAENTAFNAALGDEIRRIAATDDTVRPDEDALNLDVTSQGWQAVVPTLFPDRAPLICQRRQYLCTALQVGWKALLPDGYAVQRITPAWLDQSGLDIPDHIHEWVQANWGGRAQFGQHGFGFTLVHDGQVASWCIADCVSGDRCEIGIHTLPDHRRRGLATVAVAATVEFCFAQGFTSVGWHCMNDNIGSWKTAEKVGFMKERDYVFHLVLFDLATHWAETGWRAVQAQRYDAGVEAFQQALALKPDAPYYWRHSAAMACAGSGHADRALDYLRQAAEQGWPHVEFTQQCAEFTCLHESPEWQVILAMMQH